MDIRISYVLEKDLKPQQINQIAVLNEESFGDVPKEEAEENFIAKPFARLIAFSGEQVVGTLQLFKRGNTFLEITFTLGGIGGVCVKHEYRRNGIGRMLVKNAMRILEQENCDVVCLNTEPDEQAFNLYEKEGFKLMEREASFMNSKGQIVHDYGTMFAPLKSRKIFELIMNSKETFHYGRGYW